MQEKYQNIKNEGGNLDVNSNEETADLSNILADLGKRVDYRIELGKQYAGFCRQAHEVRMVIIDTPVIFAAILGAIFSF